MNVSGGERGLLAAPLEVVVELARGSSVAMTPLQRMEGLRRVNARLVRGRRRRAAILGLSVFGTAAAVAAAVVLVKTGSIGDVRTRAIAYSIHGGEIGDGGYIRSSDATGSLLQFAEGTELRLMAGARGRLSSVDERGARFAIEEGQAEVKVTPRPNARWLVDAGPFLITVRGTVFTAAWNGATERLDIDMKKGLVSVTGPLADGMMAVRAGQHLSVNIKKREVLLRETDAAEADEAAPGTSAAEGVVPAAATPGGLELGSDRALAARDSHANSARGTSAAGRAAAPAGSGSRNWSAALAAGDLDSILSDAERRGFRRAIAESSSEDLAALADAARYRRRNEVARQALLAERARFPRSARALDSAFLLGRLAEASPQGEGRALEWYDQYLKEAPSGAYSSEALGRKMTAMERVRGAAAARQVAEEYLRRFPGGTYAGAARALRDAR